MTTRWATRLVIVLILSSVACNKPAPKPVSFILITADTLRADHLGAYGYARSTTPNLDSFARESVLFEDVYCAMSTTLPSHATMMTGVNPLVHGVEANFDVLQKSLATNDSLRSAAEIFKEHGYTTAAFVSATPLKHHSGIQVGFDHFEEPPEDKSMLSATEQTDRVEQWLKERKPGPLFLWVHYFDPHFPYIQPEPYRAAFERTPEQANRMKRWGAKVSFKLMTLENLYDGAIKYMDAEVGRLFQILRRHGIYEDSVIVFTADHGEGIGQHDWYDHGRIYNEQVRVPLLLRMPGGKRGGERLRSLASHEDLLPTVTALVGMELTPERESQFQGSDLFAPSHDRDYAFVVRVNRHRDGWEPGRKYALVGKRWKFMMLSTGGEELYDLEADPHELSNLSQNDRTVAATMRSELTHLIASTRTKDSTGSESIPENVIEQLRSLGYRP